VGDISTFLTENQVLRKTIKKLKNPETKKLKKICKNFFQKNSNAAKVSCDKSVKI
jgi:hypothetical protein